MVVNPLLPTAILLPQTKAYMNSIMTNHDFVSARKQAPCIVLQELTDCLTTRKIVVSVLAVSHYT